MISMIYFLWTRLFTEKFLGQLLSIRAFSKDGHYGPKVSLHKWTLSEKI